MAGPGGFVGDGKYVGDGGESLQLLWDFKPWREIKGCDGRYTTKDVEADFNDPAVSWLVVEAISDEALLACVRTRFVGGRESGNRLAVFDCLASSKTSGDAGAAALNTAESAARAHGALGRI